MRRVTHPAGRGGTLAALATAAALSVGCVTASQPKAHEGDGGSSGGDPAAAAEGPAPGAAATGPVLDGSAVRRVVAAGEPGVRACYEAELERRAEAAGSQRIPAPQGRVLVRFHVALDGRVLDPEIVESAIDHDDFARCVLEEVRRWRFPSPRPDEAPVEVEVPFVLVPRLDPGT